MGSPHRLFFVFVFWHVILKCHFDILFLRFYKSVFCALKLGFNLGIESINASLICNYYD